MFHFTPASALWLNAVEGFFSAITRRQIRRGAFHSSTICRPRSHATSTPTTAILDRSYGPLPPKHSPAAYRAEAIDHAVRQRDQIAALAIRAGLSVIDPKAAGVIAIVSIGPNMGTAPDLRHMIVLEYIPQALGDELVSDRCAGRRFEISRSSSRSGRLGARQALAVGPRLARTGLR
jgi:hypothetical protein